MGWEDLLVRVDPKDYDEGMPSYPGIVLTVHCTLKGAQVGGILGCVAGVVRWRPKTWTLRGLGLGAPLGILAVVGKSQTLDADGIIDRGYRVAHNRLQTATDVLSVGGAAAGVLVSFLFRRPVLPLAAFGFVSGSTTGFANFIYEKTRSD
mmetsp:Transcript_6157/g.18605  ORF Transcript_6157/g.18605 Transcript_6157/m.18605 type:complete len:150 (+) Transcript_6157:19-468(+)